jgi:hypothetical protein
LSGTDLVERRAGMKCAVRSSSDGATMHFGVNQVRGPQTIVAAIEHVRDHQRFRIEDLPGPLSGSSKVVLARRLIREGLLRRVISPDVVHRAIDGPSDDGPVPSSGPSVGERAGDACGARVF